MANPWKTKDTLEENPIRIPENVAREVVQHLDRHMASMFVLFHQYQKHHWVVEGPQFRELHLFLQEGYERLHKDVDTLAERITGLGGIPTGAPTNLAKLSYIEHEPEGVFRVREMLERNLNAEGEIAEQMRETCTVCQNHQDFGTFYLLTKIISKVEERAHELSHFLGEDSLTLTPELQQS